MYRGIFTILRNFSDKTKAYLLKEMKNTDV